MAFCKSFSGNGLRNENSFLQLQQIDQTARNSVWDKLFLSRCILRLAAQIESFFESRESPKYWGFAGSCLAPVDVVEGCGIRTVGTHIKILDSYLLMSRVESHLLVKSFGESPPNRENLDGDYLLATL